MQIVIGPVLGLSLFLDFGHPSIRVMKKKSLDVPSERNASLELLSFYFRSELFSFKVVI